MPGLGEDWAWYKAGRGISGSYLQVGQDRPMTFLGEPISIKELFDIIKTVQERGGLQGEEPDAQANNPYHTSTQSPGSNMACQFLSSDSPGGLTEIDILGLSYERKEQCVALANRWLGWADKAETQVRRLNELVARFVQENKDKVNGAILEFGVDSVRVLFGTPQVEVDFDLQEKIAEFDILLANDPVLCDLGVESTDLSGVDVEYLNAYVNGRV